jgi:hypothetical protein
MEPARDFFFTWLTAGARRLYKSRVHEVPNSHLKVNLLFDATCYGHLVESRLMSSGAHLICYSLKFRWQGAGHGLDSQIPARRFEGEVRNIVTMAEFSIYRGFDLVCRRILLFRTVINHSLWSTFISCIYIYIHSALALQPSCVPKNLGGNKKYS